MDARTLLKGIIQLLSEKMNPYGCILRILASNAQKGIGPLAFLAVMQ